MNVRELCSLLSATLHLPGVDRWAEQLGRSKTWRDMIDLKREPLDMWTQERNAYAKRVMLEIEAQRKEARP